MGSDWTLYRDAVLQLLATGSPYTSMYFSPPWLALLMIPLAVMPWVYGAAFLFAGNLAAFGVVFYRLRIPPVWTIPLYAVTIFNSIWGNVEGLLLLGLLMPRWLGIILLMTKPQIGIGVAIYWAWQAWHGKRNHGKPREIDRTHKKSIKRLIYLVAPVATCYILAFAIYGNYMAGAAGSQFFNLSLFPWSVPVGVACVWMACRYDRLGWALMAGPLLSPYVNGFMTWGVFAIGCADVLQSGILTNIINKRKLYSYRTRIIGR
jgi:hypothetical protein